MIGDIWSYKRHALLLFLGSALLYLGFAYDLERNDFIKLFTLWCALFVLSWKLISLQRFDTNFLLGAAVVFRLLFLFSIPNLSQDFNRFLWDGNLVLKGVNPFLFSPNELLDTGRADFPFANELHEGMGSLSAGNTSNYPPISQWVFALGAFVSKNGTLYGVMILRLVLIGADLGIFYFGRKLLRHLKLPEHRIFWYLLNPFIIIELIGNLHFEGLMIFFLIGSLYLLVTGKWMWSSLFLAASIGVKLLPLLLLPLLFKYTGLLKSNFAARPQGGTGIQNIFGLPPSFKSEYRLLPLWYNLLILLGVSLCFLPFFDQDLIGSYLETTSLWFKKFEFNASVYYLIRWLGFQFTGYNIIGIAGKLLGLSVFLGILALTIWRDNHRTNILLSSLLLALSLHFLLSTTIHPWYLATPMLISIFTKYRFALLWTFTVVLSYIAYTHPTFQEHPLALTLEYLPVLLLFGYEIRKA